MRGEFRDETLREKRTYLELLEIDRAAAVLVREQKLLRDELPVFTVVLHDAQVLEERRKLILEFGDVSVGIEVRAGSGGLRRVGAVYTRARALEGS